MYIENHMDVLGIGKRQLQPWSIVGTSMPYMESKIPIHVSDYSRTHHLLPWRPNTGFENIEVIPLTRKCISNYPLDATSGTMHKPLKFPDLVTGCHRDSVHTSKAALYTRYTPNEWFQKQIKYYNEADSNRHLSERLRKDALRIVRNAEEKIQYGQLDTGRRLGERINDVSFWRNEIVSELERLLQEIERLQDCRSVLDKAIRDIDGPLHIAEECLYHREARKGTELVHDESEKCLLKEIENLKNCQRNLDVCLDKCKDQLRNCRASQNQLELDLKNKESALGIDMMCHQLNNYSHGLQYYTGIEKYDPCLSEQECWAEAANRIIQKSQHERNMSNQLRTSAEALINKVAQEMWDSWSTTNSALTHRSSELLEAKNKLQQHLQKVQQEIFDVEKNMELMRKAIADKSHAIKVAHTRLEARMHRPDLELCRDNVHSSLQKEIDEIDHQVKRMHKALKELEDQHQRLLRTRTALEHDLALKIDAIYIDREKVCGLRRAYPVNALFRF
ncbi:tektin-3-like isoform X1 [Vespa mandarinia]|uniref:tektin-3-like isoform X1 n=1 Tax=Vespa mandarinia TaxID=7446 RepID=UPI001615D512|nr:tektin-3-like isoform X1 [Vespa mandarinia]XP_046829834.1 tektin-3-like isoform X2 [Vespa crabro]